jgi:site-specific DNA recombinase
VKRNPPVHESEPHEIRIVNRLVTVIDNKRAVDLFTRILPCAEKIESEGVMTAANQILKVHDRKTSKEKTLSGYCALYVRVSTVDQGDRYSPASQLKRLREKAEREGKKVREDWIFIDNHTGKNAARPEFDKLKALVKTGAPDVVYVYDVSRFARKTMDALWLEAEFRRHGVKLDFVEMPYEDTPTGRFTFAQMAAVAEFLGEKIIEDSKRGAREKLEQGKLTHGSACYAYQYIDKRQPDGSRLEIDPSDSSVPGLPMVEVVREVYNMRKARAPTYRIVKSLNERGILSTGHFGPGGVWVPPGLWSRQTVLQLLRNPTYKGKHMRSGIQVPCPAIIDEETWNAVQRVTEECRQQHTGRPSKNRYLLRSFLWCGLCGRRCVSNPGVKAHGKPCPVYVCGNVEYKPYRRRCHAPQVPVALIEEQVWSSIWSLLKDPGLLLKLGRSYYEAMAKPEDDSTALERERERLAAKIATTLDMMQDNLIPYAKGKTDIRACEERIRQIEQELATAGRALPLPPLHAAEAALQEITAGTEPNTYERRRDILEGLVDLRMTYYKGNLEIEGKVPVPDAAYTSTGSKRKKCNTGFGTYAECDRDYR